MHLFELNYLIALPYLMQKQKQKQEQASIVKVNSGKLFQSNRCISQCKIPNVWCFRLEIKAALPLPKITKDIS